MTYVILKWTCDYCGLRCDSITCICGRKLEDFRRKLMKKQEDNQNG